MQRQQSQRRTCCFVGRAQAQSRNSARRDALRCMFRSHDHQRRNAEAMVAAGAADLLPEQALTPESLLERLLTLLVDRERLSAMGLCARSLGRPRAVSEIAAMALELTGR